MQLWPPAAWPPDNRLKRSAGCVPRSGRGVRHEGNDRLAKERWKASFDHLLVGHAGGGRTLHLLHATQEQRRDDELALATHRL